MTPISSSPADLAVLRLPRTRARNQGAGLSPMPKRPAYPIPSPHPEPHSVRNTPFAFFSRPGQTLVLVFRIVSKVGRIRWVNFFFQLKCEHPVSLVWASLSGFCRSMKCLCDLIMRQLTGRVEVMMRGLVTCCPLNC